MKYLISLSFVFVLGFLYGQEHIVRGFLTNDENSEPIPFERVILIPASENQNTIGAVTDIDGFYSITNVAVGKYTLKIQSPDFKEYTKDIDITSAKGITEINVELLPLDATEIGEVVISADAKAKTTEVQMSVVKYDQKGLERIPAYGAENDVMSAFSVTPGVVTTGDQGGQLYVRGGTPIQNKVLLDGMTIYNPFHSIGFFSIFETELVKNVDIYTGGFDAKYGGRVSSIMDITYRYGDKKHFGGNISASPFMGKIVLEGPLYRAKEGRPGAGSFVISAKHSLLDYTSKYLYRGVNSGNGLPYNFTDIYGKLTFATGQGSKVSVFGFNNYDKVNYTGSTSLGFKQAGGGMSWILLPSGGKTFIKGHLTGSRYATEFEEEGSNPRSSSIFGADLGFDFTYFLKNDGSLDYGINMNIFRTEYSTTNDIGSIIEDQNNTTEFGAYVDYKLVTKRWVVEPSFRLQVYSSMSTVSPEPRLGAKYNATEKLRFKFAGGRYSQNFTTTSSDRDIVNLFNGLLSAPTNVQSTFITQNGNTKNPKNGLQYSWHAILGGEYDVNKYLMINLEGYYKYFPQLSNINVNKLYEDNAEFASIDDVYKKNFIIESGQSYGADLLVKFNMNRLFIWGVYSYARNTRWDGFAVYSPVFDRRHNINLVVSYLVGKKKDLEFNARWNFGSGLPFTPTAGFYQAESFSDGTTTDYTTSNSSSPSILLGEFNSSRLPTYHRLDITIKKRFIFKNKTEMELVGSVTNAYNRKNIFYVNRVTNKVIYQFPILPSLGLSYKF